MTKRIKLRAPVLFYLIAILGMFTSCSDNNSNEQITPAQKTDSVAPPVTVLITNPIRVNLDTCPPPKQSNYFPPAQKVLDTLIAQGICNFTTYSTDNGLPLDAISCSLIDKTGNLWFGTDGGGVSRYDGKSFVNYTTIQGLADNVVWDIVEDRNGNLWFGTAGGGVTRYDGSTFTNFTTDDGLANNLVRSIAEDQSGNLWFGTEGGGVSRYDPSTPLATGGKIFTNFTTQDGLVSNRIRCITIDQKGNTWFGTEGGGISRYDSKSFTSYTVKEGLANNVVLSSAEDSEGNMWFGTGGYGVSRFDGNSFTTFSATHGLANNIVWNILEDRSGNLWFGTNGGGVSCFNGESFTNFTTAQGLGNNVVLSITEDANGSLWFGTYGGGVSRYDGGSFVNYTVAHGLVNNFVRTVFEDRSGNLWFGTSGGVSLYDGKSFSNYTTEQGLAQNSVLSVTEDRNGALWFGTGGSGVSRFNGKEFTTYTVAQGLAHNFVRSILEDRYGNLWFATRGGGVSCFDGKSFTNYTTAQGLASDLVWSITEDRNGNIWFGTEGGGVSCYDGKSFINYTTEQGLANNVVWNIKEDKSGNLWFATYGGGVSVFNPSAAPGTSGKSFQNFTTADGLPDNTITQIIIDSAQNIFLGTNLGVAMIPAFNVNSGTGLLPQVEVFNSATGFPVKDVNVGQNAMYEDSHGVIWIATGSDKTGLVRFDRALLHKTDRPPAVVIQSIKLNNENTCWYSFTPSDSAVLAQQEILTFGKILSPQERDTLQQRYSGIRFDSISKWNPLPENLELPYEHNNVTFEFSAIEPSRPWLVNYQYILEGYDKEWSPALKKTNATFGNIGEGTYTFKLKAQYPSGTWSEPVSYTFIVHPPWWRTWWAYCMYGVLFIATVSLIVLWNGRRLRARAAELTEEVRIATLTISEEKAKIELANVEISRQKEIVEEKHKEITDSINYALRIQQAFLPDKKEIYSSLPQSFILFKPKDIVSGDFYFFHKKNDTVFIAAVDCTGHGVPGAFMSMVGSERLTDAVQQSNDTGEILSLLNKGVKTSLKQSGHDESTRDGMDIAICSVDARNRILKYAGANRPLWISRHGSTSPTAGAQTEMEEIKATKVAIGGLTPDDQSFATHEIKLQQGDTFYICTDGYADQFSSKNGKKLMTRKLKEILMSIQNKSMQEQEQYLDNFIEEWKAGTEQVDDILIIGIRV